MNGSKGRTPVSGRRRNRLQPRNPGWLQGVGEQRDSLAPALQEGHATVPGAGQHLSPQRGHKPCPASSSPQSQIPGAAPGTAPELGEGSKHHPKIHSIKKPGSEPPLAFMAEGAGLIFLLRIQSKWTSLRLRWECRDDSASRTERALSGPGIQLGSTHGKKTLLFPFAWCVSIKDHSKQP